MSQNLLRLLQRLEWSASREAAPYGSMVYSRPGPNIPACPSCGGIHPDKGHNEFETQALGHRPDCELAAAIRRLETAPPTESLELHGVNDDSLLQLSAPVTLTLAESGGKPSLRLNTDTTIATFSVEEDGEVTVEVYGTEETRRITVYKGEVEQSRRPVTDLEVGEVLDIGEGCLYDIKTAGLRGDTLHLLLEGDGTVWHLQLGEAEELVRSQTQPGLWALQDSAVDTEALRAVY